MTDSAEPATNHSGDVNKMVDPFREAARQAAREAVAASPAWSFYSTDEILAGKADRSPALWSALLGADAALAAIAPLIRAQCAEVARERAKVNLSMADWHRAEGDTHSPKTWVRDARSNEAERIERAILALNEKETT